MPVLCDRPDVIVLTDLRPLEVNMIHWRLNMRARVAQGAVSGVHGHATDGGRERTKDVFRRYVSILNFQQSSKTRDRAAFLREPHPELQLVTRI